MKNAKIIKLIIAALIMATMASCMASCAHRPRGPFGMGGRDHGGIILHF